MQKLFNKILVPVDLTERSEKAVEKAGEIAAQFNCSVYLLHVRYLSPLAAMNFVDSSQAGPITKFDDKTELKNQLAKMCEMARIASNNTVNFEYCIQTGNWDEIVIEFANLNGIDLILI